ncbi:MAG: sulfotransferase [Rickettsiales bacterium]|nr:sulfotransferase [Rickettsiales bacterium]
MITQPILVVGMHRSGTSALTGLLQLMGAHVGEAAALLPASPDNPKGFFERNDVLATNQAIMRQMGCNWHSTEAWDERNFVQLDASVNASMRTIVHTLSKHPVWVMKDPRFCFTLPCWLNYIQNPIILTTERDPYEIADSLTRRNGFTQEAGLALAARYETQLQNNTQNLQTILCRFEHLMHDPLGMVDYLLESIPLLTRPNDGTVLSFIQYPPRP